MQGRGTQASSTGPPTTQRARQRAERVAVTQRALRPRAAPTAVPAVDVYRAVPYTRKLAGHEVCFYPGPASGETS
jgi:hypothetical protein